MQPRGTSLHRGLEVGKGSVAVFRELDHMNETPISRRDKMFRLSLTFIVDRAEIVSKSMTEHFHMSETQQLIDRADMIESRPFI